MTELNDSTGDPTDGREAYKWETCYAKQARDKIRKEAIYLIFLFLSSFLLIFVIWHGYISASLSLTPIKYLTFQKYAYYTVTGMLGGVVFGIKYLYRVVARGYWHEDRRLWRFLSPLNAMAIAFIVGAMIDASFISKPEPISSAATVSIGFLSGYFADEAIGKMYEIAGVIFGKSATTKGGDGKEKTS